jgi:hypothetical protein
MNYRAFGFALALTCVQPFVPELLAHAQGAAKDDAVTEGARQRFQEGVRLYDLKKFEEARVAFLQAYALKHHPAVLLNLAQSELRSHHAVDAARHFSQYLHEATDAKPAERKVAEQGLVEARTKTARLQIEVNVSGADVLVDDESIGKSPLSEAIDVAPGARKVEARVPGAPNASTTVNAAVGHVMSVSLKLEQPGVAAAAASPGTANLVAPSASQPAPVAPAPPSKASNAATGSDQSAGEPTQGETESFFQWTARDPVAWLTEGATVAGIVVGAVFTYYASAATSNADGLINEISSKAAYDNETLNPFEGDGTDRRANPCADPKPEKYAGACSNLRDTLDKRDTDRTIAIVGWSVAGAGLVSTIVAYFSLRSTPSSKTSGSNHSTRSVTTLVPIISPTMSGLTLGTTF